jgi:hypothetical protein
MDEQGIYCPQCRAYVHFWMLTDGRRPPEAGPTQPGIPIEMPAGCGQCGYKSTYKSSDLRTRRVPTMAMPASIVADARRAMKIDVQSVLDADEKPPGSK